MMYFILAWDNDSESKRYGEFYFITDQEGKIRMFNNESDAVKFARKNCRYFKIVDFHNYMVGEKIIEYI